MGAPAPPSKSLQHTRVYTWAAMSSSHAPLACRCIDIDKTQRCLRGSSRPLRHGGERRVAGAAPCGGVALRSHADLRSLPHRTSRSSTPGPTLPRRAAACALWGAREGCSTDGRPGGSERGARSAKEGAAPNLADVGLAELGVGRTSAALARFSTAQPCDKIRKNNLAGRARPCRVCGRG